MAQRVVARETWYIDLVPLKLLRGQGLESHIVYVSFEEGQVSAVL